LIKLTVAVGLTVIVNVVGVPAHPFADGVTVIVAVIGEVVAFVVVNAGTLPEPFAPSPIAVLLFVHVKDVPLTGPDKLVAGAITPAQKVWLPIELTVAVGLTVIVNVVGVPVHPFAEGVTVIVAVIGEVVAFVAVNAGTLPEPLAASPMAVLLFVHVNVVPLTGPEMFVIGAAEPAQ
jgi:hypothetical protein